MSLHFSLISRLTGFLYHIFKFCAKRNSSTTVFHKSGIREADFRIPTQTRMVSVLSTSTIRYYSFCLLSMSMITEFSYWKERRVVQLFSPFELEGNNFFFFTIWLNLFYMPGECNILSRMTITLCIKPTFSAYVAWYKTSIR